MDFDSMSLSDLFAAADSIGDKYLSPEGIEQRDRELEALAADILADHAEFVRLCDESKALEAKVYG